MYRPNFCVECGARLEGAVRRWWASRRFCGGCARRFRTARLLWPLAAGGALLTGGFLLGRGARPQPPPLIIESREAVARPSASGAGAAPAGPAGQFGEPPTDPGETVSICGARTKRGAPCSRRVRGTGRCWQHRGKPAMLPPSKLVVPDGG